MSNALTPIDLIPITADAPVCQTLRSLPEKFIVDFANGIDVARDHLRVQRGRTSFFNRLYDGFTGQGARRQAEINASVVDGVEASLNWLCELSESLAQSNLAMAQVNDRVTWLTDHVAELAHYSANTRQQLETLAHRLGERMQVMAEEIKRIDFIQQVQLNLDAVFSKWEAGCFATLSPAARCYAALEELRWGALGDYCRAYAGHRQCSDFMQIAANRATKQLTVDIEGVLETPVDTAKVWLTAPSSTGRDDDADNMRQALAYLADGMTEDCAPFVSAAALHPANLPLKVPRIAAPRRVAEAMVYEVFPKVAGNA